MGDILEILTNIPRTVEGIIFTAIILFILYIKDTLNKWIIHQDKMNSNFHHKMDANQLRTDNSLNALNTKVDTLMREISNMTGYLKAMEINK